MKYQRFEDLPVWKAAVELAEGAYALTRDTVFRQPGDLRDQLRRAALSVSNNVAEGFERGSTAELLAFLYVAPGSAGEVRSMLKVLAGWSVVADLKSQISDLTNESENISRQLYGWIENLKNSEISGQLHLDDKARNRFANKQQQQDFSEEIGRINQIEARKRQVTSKPPQGS